MIIAVNARLLLKNRLEGIGWFTYETLKIITRQHKEHQFVFIFDRHYSDEFIFSDNITPVVTGPPSRHPFLWYWWFEKSVPAILKKYKPEIFLSPDGHLSLTTQVPSIAVIHDLNFEHCPENLPFLVRKYYKYYFPRFAQKAKRIATVSEYSKKDIQKHYNISYDKIDVVYNGANEIYVPITEEAQKKCLEKYTSGKPFFLFIGTLLPRKNVATLFKSFDLFRKTSMNDIKLVVVGQQKWWTDEIRKVYEEMEYQRDVIFTGHLPPEKLGELIPSALALWYVSLFEGFGIPIIEAMRCGTPVITSTVSSMPEVAAGAAMLADPYSVNSITDQMVKIATDKRMRKELIEKGLERSKFFTWEKTAAGLWQTIEKTSPKYA